MSELPAFQKYQYAFTRHIRDPQTHAKPDNIEDRRMAIYRDLLFNNVKNFIENGFPVLHALYEEDTWLTLVRSFFAKHQSHSPYFVEISQEFLLFLQNEYEPTEHDPAFMLELAHYEWIELDLMVSKEEAKREGIDPHGDLLQGIPVISPLVRALAYQWDVQNISVDYQPISPPEHLTYLIVHRDNNEAVKFIEANPVTARLVALIQENTGQTGQQMLESIATELQHPDPAMVVQGGHQILLKLLKAGVLLGTRTA
jgi:hypothetical protein